MFPASCSTTSSAWSGHITIELIDGAHTSDVHVCLLAVIKWPRFSSFGRQRVAIGAGPHNFGVVTVLLHLNLPSSS